MPGDPDPETVDKCIGKPVPYIVEGINDPDEFWGHYTQFGDPLVDTDDNGYKVTLRYQKRIHRYAYVPGTVKAFSFVGEEHHEYCEDDE